MIKIIERHLGMEERIIEAKDMQPLQVGIVVDSSYKGEVVMRTASTDAGSFEIISISKPGPDRSWISPECSLQIRLLNPGESFTLKISNDIEEES